MKRLKILSNEQGALLLIFVVTTLVAGTAGYLSIRVAQQSGDQYSEYLDDIANDRPITEAQQDQAMGSFHTQIQVLTGAGNLINSVDVSPNEGSVVSAFAGGATGNMVDQGSNPNRPTGDNPLPSDVSSGGDSSEPEPEPTPEPTNGCAGGYTFDCGDGTTICAELACNSATDCANGADESDATCGTGASCCVATAGCPGETGSSCADSCCCCGYGEACDQSNWANGCVGVATRLNIDPFNLPEKLLMELE